MSNQPGYRGTAGLVAAEHLSQEHPQCHEWREDSVVPACANRGECLRDDFRREHVRKRQVSVLKELTSQKTHLSRKPSLCTVPHPWASLPVMGVLPNLIYAREAFLAYVNSPEHYTRNLRAIRRSDQRAHCTSTILLETLVSACRSVGLRG
jgi:hypothetical protein